MQANKASNETKEQLMKWLQSPAATSKSAKDDLAWLSDTKDLSAVSIDPEKRSEPPPVTEPKESHESKRSLKPKPSIGGGGSGGGLLSLFGCASKRK